MAVKRVIWSGVMGTCGTGILDAVVVAILTDSIDYRCCGGETGYEAFYAGENSSRCMLLYWLSGFVME